jgi:DNA-directed RNA polymerase subunit beta'
METKFICDYDNLTDRYGRFFVKPLEKGAGRILGNALRRVLLSQLEGAAVTAVRIQGVLHEFAPIPGAVEDTSEVLHNLKRLELRAAAPGVIRVSVDGKGAVRARDLKTDDDITILNPDAHIVTLEAGAAFSAEMEVDKGIGFRQADPAGRAIGVIAVDADFCPVKRVGYAVEELEEDGELLSLELTTDGSISPVEALKKAVEILKTGLTGEKLIKGKFDKTSGKFVINARPGGHTTGSMLCWSLMSLEEKTQDTRLKTQDKDPESSKYEPVKFADYELQEDGSLTLEVHTDGSLGPKEAVSLAGKRLSGMLDTFLSPPAMERGRPPVARRPSALCNGSVSFGDAASFWQAPDLLDVQRSSYERFMQMGVPPQDRKPHGLQKILNEVFPIKSNGLVLDCPGYSCSEPLRSPVECLDLSLTYSIPVTLHTKLTAEEAGRTVEEEVPIGEIPLMTDEGVFIVRGLKRAVISQLVGADPGDFNDLSRKRANIVGDLLCKEMADAFARLKTIASERMAVENGEELQPSSLLCVEDSDGRGPHIEPVTAALNRFFLSNSLSQALQECNLLDALTHCRRIKQDTSGISVDNVPEEPRVLHHTSYGRLGSMETPEGPSVGLIGTLAMHACIDDEGFVKAPYHKVEKGKASQEIIYLSAQEESDLTISPASEPLNSKTVSARAGGNVRRVDPKEVDYVDAFKQQTLGPSTSLIPLLEHSDPNRALMGANMQRQAVPLIFTEQPLIQTGAEGKIALDSRAVVAAKRDGVVRRVTAEKIEIATEDGMDVYHLLKHRPAGVTRNLANQKPIVYSGQKVTKGQVIADGSSTKDGLLSLGRNIMVAYMPWEGYNFEDAILVSERMIKEDIFTSLHIQTFQAEIRDTRYGREMFTRQVPGVEESRLSNLDSDGIVKVGAYVCEGDILVGKVTPKAAESSPEDKLLHALTQKANYENASLNMWPGTAGRVTRVQRLSRTKGDPLPKGVYELVKVEVTGKRKAKVGDKLSGRHGNKGTISRILPEEDMPFMPDGTPVEMLLNPLGVPSRMNLGQLMETHLGWAARTLDVRVISPPFDGPSHSQIRELLSKAGLPSSGMAKMHDGRTGKAVDTDITVGYQYMMKLIHMVDDKIHARSTGPYSLFTQQPTGGRAHFGGQRFGEMETWALEAYGAAYTLRELLTVKSDDVVGRRRMYESLLKGIDSAPAPFVPETLRKLILCLRGVAYDMKPEEDSRRKTQDARQEKEPFSVDEIGAVTISLASPETIRDEWSHGEVEVESSSWENHRPTPGGLFCEKIFGPVKDWQCQCGKLSGRQHEGQVCDECGVEVGPANMRNERMGHIHLAVPVCHSWFLSARPNPIAILLGMEPDDVRKVVYYESYVVTDPGDTGLSYRQILSKEEYEARRKEKESFEAKTGAPALCELLCDVDLAELSESLDDPQEKRLIEALRKSGIKPEWIVLEYLPVIPPGMRPTTHLEGGGVATLDLNELYAVVISRNNKYRELTAIDGQEAHDTARMVQEAVDSLFGNGRRREGEAGKLRSLSDLLKGKTGMFRSNLLGKRVDFSGRSVIVVGPDLKLDECGLPESMALELFRPFILHRLLSSGAAHSISSARRMIDGKAAEALQAVREVANERLVMLNRAPTLHRIGIQTFKPVLTDLSSIRLHPLVCVGFNADFDGDQMAVHIPLSAEAQSEARQLMLSHKNVLSPAHGGTIAQPAQEMIVGCYYMTQAGKGTPLQGGVMDVLEVKKAYELDRLSLQDSIGFLFKGEKIDTTVGRVLFNEIVPPGLGRFINQQVDKPYLFSLIEECHARLGEDETARFLNDLDDLGFKYATRFGTSIGIDVLKTISDKDQFVHEVETREAQIKKSLADGQISHEEAMRKRLEAWGEIADKLEDVVMKIPGPGSDSINPVVLMVESGARGKPHQLKSLVGLMGLVTRSSSELFDMPVNSNYTDGLSLLEHFMVTTGARRGLIDVAIRVSRAGYLMRKMTSAVRDVIITEDDCGTEDGITMKALASDGEVMRHLSRRISGRVAAQDVKHPGTGEIMASAGALIDEDAVRKIEDAGVQEVKVRSPLTCKTDYGICARCYGFDLATGGMVKLGAPVGAIAGAAVGEPAVQLTMRTFILKRGRSDYAVSGLPRLEELLEARESAEIPVEGPSLPLKEILSQKGEEVFRSLMLDELMSFYGHYGLNVNDKHFEILLSRMLSMVRITNAGGTSLYSGELVSRSQLRLENKKAKSKAKRASAEPVLIGLREAALSTESFLAAAAFGDTINVLTQAAIRCGRDDLRGMSENLIVGKLIPAGTGFRTSQNIK